MRKIQNVFYIVSTDRKYYIGGKGSTYRLCCKSEYLSLEDSVPPQIYLDIKTAEDKAKSFEERTILGDDNKKLDIKFEVIPGQLIYEL